MPDALAIRPTNGPADIVERVVVAGDLARLSPAERVRYYGETCRSLGLNPLTRPFEYITLNNKLTLYALKGATDQLRALHGISITGLEEALSEDGILTVTAMARTRDGRTDRDVGVVSLAGLRGEALANARMRAITKSKRRVTLSICGLGWLDESEVDSIPDAHRVRVDTTTGEITETEDMRALASPPRERSRDVPEGKRWSEAQLAWFWAQLGALSPKVTGDELHAILSDAAGERVESIHAAPDLDAALQLVFDARQRNEPVPSGRGSAAVHSERAVDRGDLGEEDAPRQEVEHPLHGVEHPAGSVEHEWARYTALAALAARWNRDYPEQAIRWPEPPQDAPAVQVRATADGLERRLKRLEYAGSAQ